MIPYYHVDVFSNRPLCGNGLIVFTEAAGLSKTSMLTLTQEMRQFESIFLERMDDRTFRASIFTCQEELDFAGHPILGAAATLHGLYRPSDEVADWVFVLNQKTMEVKSEKQTGTMEMKGVQGSIVDGQTNIFKATMHQGAAVFGKRLNERETMWLLDGIGLSMDDLEPGYVPEVVSTGLPYMIIPLRKNVFRAKIRTPDLEEKIRGWGAMFIGILDIPTLRIRSGDNGGLVEDIATGSLAGPAGAYLVNYGFQPAGTIMTIHQGENLGRPSQLYTEVRRGESDTPSVYVSGYVCKIAAGHLDAVLSADLLA